MHEFEKVAMEIDKSKRCEICRFPLLNTDPRTRFCKPCAHVNKHFTMFLNDFSTLNDEGKNYFMFKVTRLWAKTFL